MYNINARQFDFGDWEKIQDFDFRCPVCDGNEETEEECPECDGSGMIVCDECLGESEECDVCDDNGEVFCDECCGNGTVPIPCEWCEDDGGMIMPIWNTAWEIEQYSISNLQKLDVVTNTNCTVFEDDEGTYYLGLTGCGMDMTPSMCKAWLILGMGWLPMEWIDNITDRQYCEYVAGKEWTEKIYKIATETLEQAERRIQYKIKNFKGE
jgi:hypothetical protein